jgi:mono/diheme cytochrome c family protein
MKRLLKWAMITVVVVAVFGFLAFLYFIPPFFLVAPETFAKQIGEAPPGVADIEDPAERVMAERGRYLVMTTGCIGCHQMPGPKGPQLDKYLAGGAMTRSRDGVFFTRNLTPDSETGLGRRTDNEVKRVLRSGVFPDGHVTSHTIMPWAGFSNWTEEDRHAVVAYLRHLPAVRHQIPEPSAPSMSYPGAAVEVYGGKDYGVAR